MTYWLLFVMWSGLGINAQTVDAYYTHQECELHHVQALTVPKGVSVVAYCKPVREVMSDVD